MSTRRPLQDLLREWHVKSLMKHSEKKAQSYRPFRGIVLTPAHRRARLAWAIRMQRKTQVESIKVLVTDETCILLQCVDGRMRIFGRHGERLARTCTIQADRFGVGGSLMMWGGISGSHRTDLVVIGGNVTGTMMKS